MKGVPPLPASLPLLFAAAVLGIAATLVGHPAARIAGSMLLLGAGGMLLTASRRPDRSATAMTSVGIAAILCLAAGLNAMTPT